MLFSWQRLEFLPKKENYLMTTAEIRSRQSAHRLYIGGAWRDARGSGRLAVLNPATGQQIAEVAAAGVEDVDAAVTAAHERRTASRISLRSRRKA